MREYETVFVLHPTYDEKEVEAEIQAVSEMITGSGGNVLEIDRWGRRRLAYEIKRVHEGIYTLLRYSSDTAVLKEIERRFRLNERMLRYMTVISEGPLAPPRVEGSGEGTGFVERRPYGSPADSGAGRETAPRAAAVDAAPEVLAPAAPPPVSEIPVADAPEAGPDNNASN